MRTDNLTMLQDTLTIMQKGFYMVNGRRVECKLNPDQMKETKVYLPEEVHVISETKGPGMIMMGRVGVSCANVDSLTMARESHEHMPHFSHGNGKPVLVLNFANPVNPGGGVRRGANAQEEDLCRKSSLLLSLESANAMTYYNYNQSRHTYLGSNAVMITPQVEVIRDKNGDLLPESLVVAVMTCAAPMLRNGLEGLTDSEYRELFYQRIKGMLSVAASLEYRKLVLGAFGCGAFGNDAHIVSDLFYKAMKAFRYSGRDVEACFDSIDFAVLDRSRDQYNFREFSRNFSDFYREEDEREKRRVMEEIKKTEDKLDAIRGSMIGGAVGDALGYAIEFWHEDQIFRTYGSKGISEYALMGGKALISDDTQMALFTANGILVRETRMRMRGGAGDPRVYVARTYQDWLKTQQSDIRTVNQNARYTPEGGISWLLDIPELYSRRAPGNTCLSSLRQRYDGKHVADYIENSVNHSKGCGGIMRIAPLALRLRPGKAHPEVLESLDREAAQIAAITHGHSLGYMPAAVVNHIICRILSSDPEMTLKEIILEARDTAAKIFAGDKHLAELTGIMDRAVRLSENSASDLDNIHALGEGWVAEETLGIALYCSLKYQNDFSKAMIASVNHRGDSDSTGAVTGNIVGALVGYEAIEEKWKKNLELRDIILEMADDLCHGCQMSEYGIYRDPAWESKYLLMHRYSGMSE